MPNRTFAPWSDNPYAPQIPHELYFVEKVSFARPLVSGIAYGVVVVLFFQCLGALLNPIGRARGGIKWGLVAHTALMFLFVTIFTLVCPSRSGFIDNREYPGDDIYPPGPFGYELSLFPDPLNTLHNSMFYLNQWLADGLLLYRCYIIYAMNSWAVAFPCLMYLTTLAMGILIIHETWRPEVGSEFYIADRLAIRLPCHSTKNLRDAMGPLSRHDRLYRTTITILIESSALYAVNFIVYIGPWGVKGAVSGVIFPLLAQTQVIAPFLTTLRVANRTALTANNVPTRNTDVGSFRFRSEGKSTGHETLPDGNPVTASGEASGERGVRVETTVDQTQL